MIQEFTNFAHLIFDGTNTCTFSVIAEVASVLVADFELADKAYDRAFMRSPPVRDNTVLCFFCLQVARGHVVT